MPYSGSRIRPFPGELLFQWKLQIEKECIWSWRWPPALGSPKPLARLEQVREKLHQQEVQDSLGKGEGQISRPRKEQVLSLSLFPGCSDSKESALQHRGCRLTPGWERFPGEEKGKPTPVFLPAEFHGQRSLAGYSPWGPKESAMTEQLTLSLWHCFFQNNIFLLEPSVCQSWF